MNGITECGMNRLAVSLLCIGMVTACDRLEDLPYLTHSATSSRREVALDLTRRRSYRFVALGEVGTRNERPCATVA